MPALYYKKEQNGAKHFYEMHHKTAESNLQPVFRQKEKKKHLKSFLPKIFLKQKLKSCSCQNNKGTLQVLLQFMPYEIYSKKKTNFFITQMLIIMKMVWLSSLPISRLSDRWMPNSRQFLGM